MYLIHLFFAVGFVRGYNVYLFFISQGRIDKNMQRIFGNPIIRAGRITEYIFAEMWHMPVYCFELCPLHSCSAI